MKMLPTGLFSRFLIIILLPMVLLQIIVVIIFYERHWDRVTAHLQRNLIAELKTTIELIEHYPGKHLLLNNAIENFGFKYQILKDNSLSTLQPIKQDILLQEFSKNLQRSFHHAFIVQYSDNSSNINLYLPIKQDVIKLTFSSKRLRSPTTYIFVFWIIGVATLLIIISTVFIRNQIKSIIKLAEAADQFGKGKNIEYFKPSGAKEIRTAGKAFIKMKKRIERQIHYRTELLAHISHDLRTPLTRLKLQLTMLDASSSIEEMQQDIREMEKMIVDYLNFAKGEGNETVIMIEVKPTIIKILDSFNDARLNINYDLSEGQVCFMRPLAFQRTIQNVISNAIKYAHHKIDFLITTSDKNLIIIVDDDGEGISPENYKDALKPFNKLDDTHPGHGLGLAIVKNIMQAHGGKVKLNKSSYGGLRVTLSFPL